MKLFMLIILMAIVGSIAIVSGCSGTASPAPSQVAVPPVPPTGVMIKNLAFSPATINVTAGSSVTWTNVDGFTHTVVFNDQASAAIGRGETYTRTFDKVGEYDYSCGIHPSMKGKVIVI